MRDTCIQIFHTTFMGQAGINQISLTGMHLALYYNQMFFSCLTKQNLTNFLCKVIFILLLVELQLILLKYKAIKSTSKSHSLAYSPILLSSFYSCS